MNFAQVLLKTRRPDGNDLELAVVDLEKPLTRWTRVSGVLKAAGTTDQAILEIRIQGKGNLWVDKVSVMPEQNRHGWRNDVVEAIKESRPAVIRWGGSVVDPALIAGKEGSAIAISACRFSTQTGAESTRTTWVSASSVGFAKSSAPSLWSA